MYHSQTCEEGSQALSPSLFLFLCCMLSKTKITRGDRTCDVQEGGHALCVGGVFSELVQGSRRPMAEKAVVCGSKMVRVLMMLLASGLAVYTVAPAVYWHVVAEDGDVLTKWVLQCPPCPPDFDACRSPSSLADSASKVLAIAQKLNSTTGIQGFNRDMKEDIGKTLAQLLKEGLKLQKEAKAAQQRSTSAGYLDASKKAVVVRNQKGSTSEKGLVGCAQAEAELAKETTRANLWEKRAKDLGWKPKPGSSQKYKKYIQMLDGGA